MISFFVYLITGVATGWQVFQLMMWAIWGRPVQVLDYIGFAGAFILVLASCFVLWKKVSTSVAAIACVTLWIFYVPFLTGIIRAFASGTAVFWDWKDAVQTIAAPVFLVATTFHIGNELRNLRAKLR